MRIIIDFDDCICHGFPESPVPDIEIIENIKRIKKEKKETIITIHTARGQVSCFGDPSLASKKYRVGIETFLKENNVPYDEIIFGKPFGDVYIDDKAVSSREFKKSQFECFSGNSGADCCRIGDMFIKIYNAFPNSAKYECGWYKSFRNVFGKKEIYSCPEVISYSYNTIHLKFIEGNQILRERDTDYFSFLFKYIKEESKICLNNENDVGSFVEYIRNKGCLLNTFLSEEEECILLNSDEIKKKTFFHGDMTQQNVIVGKDGVLYLVDPGYGRGIDNWLQDAGKLRASLCGLDDAILGLKPQKKQDLLIKFDKQFSEFTKEISVLQKAHCIRVAHTNLENGKFDNIQSILGISNA